MNKYVINFFHFSDLTNKSIESIAPELSKVLAPLAKLLKCEDVLRDPKNLQKSKKTLCTVILKKWRNVQQEKSVENLFALVKTMGKVEQEKECIKNQDKIPVSFINL